MTAPGSGSTANGKLLPKRPESLSLGKKSLQAASSKRASLGEGLKVAGGGSKGGLKL